MLPEWLVIIYPASVSLLVMMTNILFYYYSQYSYMYYQVVIRPHQNIFIL